MVEFLKPFAPMLKQRLYRASYWFWLRGTFTELVTASSHQLKSCLRRLFTSSSVSTVLMRCCSSGLMRCPTPIVHRPLESLYALLREPSSLVMKERVDFAIAMMFSSIWVYRSVRWITANIPNNHNSTAIKRFILMNRIVYSRNLKLSARCRLWQLPGQEKCHPRQKGTTQFHLVHCWSLGCDWDAHAT